MEKNEVLVICFGFDIFTITVKSFNFVFCNCKQFISFIEASFILSKFSCFISDIIVKGSTLSNNFFGIIFVGIGGALLLMKSNTPDAVEFTFSKNDWDDLFWRLSWFAGGNGDWGLILLFKFICWVGLYNGIWEIWELFGGNAWLSDCFGFGTGIDDWFWIGWFWD